MTSMKKIRGNYITSADEEAKNAIEKLISNQGTKKITLKTLIAALMFVFLVASAGFTEQDDCEDKGFSDASSDEGSSDASDDDVEYSPDVASSLNYKTRKKRKHQ